MESETVWRALASPHRRKLLDLLRDGARTTGELSKEMSDLSRFGVMQHLSVLEEAHLVLVRREGRSRFNYLNPAPIQQVYERWMRSGSSIAAETAQHLKRYAESTHEEDVKVDQTQYRQITIEMELVIKAPPERVFKAISEELGNWWPHRYKPDSEVFSEARLGGRSGENFKNGGGAIYGEVVYYDQDRLLISAGASVLNRGTSSYLRQEVLPHPEGTLYKRSSQIWGTISDDLEKMYREGTKKLMEDALIGYLERGETYQAVNE